MKKKIVKEEISNNEKMLLKKESIKIQDKIFYEEVYQMIIDFGFIKPLFDTFLDEHFSEFFRLFDKENDFRIFKPFQSDLPLREKYIKKGYIQDKENEELTELWGYEEGNPFLLWYQRKLFFIQLSNLNSLKYYEKFEPKPEDNNVGEFCKAICLKSFSLVMKSDYNILEILSLKYKHLNREKSLLHSLLDKINSGDKRKPRKNLNDYIEEFFKTNKEYDKQKSNVALAKEIRIWILDKYPEKDFSIQTIRPRLSHLRP